MIPASSSFVPALLRAAGMEEQLALYSFSLDTSGTESWSWFWECCLFGEPGRLKLPGNENTSVSRLVQLMITVVVFVLPERQEEKLKNNNRDLSMVRKLKPVPNC